MMHRKLVVAVAVAVTGVAVAASAADSAVAPSKTTIKVTTSVSIKPNRYIQDGLRWDKDVYQVKSGGTLKVVNTAADEGPHTFTVVKQTDLPKSGAFRGCKICDTLGKAHGADPNSDTPPKFAFLENGVGQDTPPDVDRPGDSGVTGSGKKGESISLKVTAKKGTSLHFVCLIHPWMQAKVLVK
ncbi:MAG: hypothetical protein JWO02_1274 [Solirubrobacterales bacterium]|nr:hypothetical protein [Solirubrobacterales bacterium]